MLWETGYGISPADHPHTHARAWGVCWPVVFAMMGNQRRRYLAPTPERTESRLVQAKGLSKKKLNVKPPVQAEVGSIAGRFAGSEKYRQNSQNTAKILTPYNFVRKNT